MSKNDMIDEEIVALARNVNPKVAPNDITLLPGGYSSQAYKVGGDEPFVLLVERAGAVGTVDYGRASLALTLLKKHNYQHCPELLWLKDDKQAMAMSYFDGEASDKYDFRDVNPESLAIHVIDALLDTAAVTLDEYRQSAKQFNIPEIHIATTSEGLRKYGSERYEIAKSSCPDKDIIDWLGPRLERSIELGKKHVSQEIMFGHGDPSGPNILIGPKGDFTLIDWDASRFHDYGPEFYVGYTTHLTPFMHPYREQLISHVAQRLGIDREELATRVNNRRIREEVFGVVWAAMMMAKVNTGEAAGDMNHFRSIAHERMAQYEEDFGKSV